jgi:hypothetical protein
MKRVAGLFLAEAVQLDRKGCDRRKDTLVRARVNGGATDDSVSHAHHTHATSGTCDSGAVAA